MRISPISTLFLSVLFVVPAIGQTAEVRPQPILVDQIGGRQLKLVPSVERGSAAPNSPNSATSAAFATERRAFELMNAERQASGLRMLEWDDKIAEIARQHARNMADGKFFSHRGADGSMVDQRAARSGVSWIGIGENIAALRGHEDPAAFAVETWMNSASHKRNILNGQWQYSAIGAVTAEDGTVYLTQVFIFR